MSVRITTATTEDVQTIRVIAHETWPIAYREILTKEQISYMLDLFYGTSSLEKQIAEGHTFLLATLKDKAIGFASYNEIGTKIYKLQKIYVLPGEQGTGAGKKLLETVEKEVQKLGGDRLQLNVNRKNKAKAFYEKAGFTVIEEKDINIGNDYWMNDFIMEKQLH